MFFEKASVSVSLYYFYLQFKSVFFLKSRKIWGRWSTKCIHLFFMPFSHCLLIVSCLHGTGFLDIALQWMCCNGRVAVPAACKTCLNMFAIIISANQQQLPEDHKWKQEMVISHSVAGISKISSAKFHTEGKSCFPRLRASSRLISQLSVQSAV